MDQTILLVAVIVVLLAVVGWLLYERRRSDQLRSEFGPEYKRTVEAAGDRRAGEAELRERQQRVEALDIRPLPPRERDAYAQEWREVQARFVDEPTGAISDADALIGKVMEARGYPVADFEQRAADVSVGHANVVEHYRAAHEIASRRDDLGTDTEALRQAMVHYRALFEDLLEPSNGTEESASKPTTEREPAGRPS
jgi:predicted nucleic acid-binding protein